MNGTSLKCRVSLAIAMLTITIPVLCGCGKIAGTGAPIESETNGTEDMPSSNTDAAFIDDAQDDIISDEAASDILTQLQIEAGTQELTAADLFEEYTGQEVAFHMTLSRDELAAAGAIYELQVVYLEQPVTITVEITDTTPPQIEGIRQLWAEAGNTVSYKKGISLSDNALGEIDLFVDNDSVNLNTPGTYPVYYTATDASGNQTKAETTITITAPKMPTEEETIALADEIITSVITENMSKYDIAYTLWVWCRENMSYSARTEDYATVWEGAYDGLKTRRGDCYTYCATYSFLLTRCGIENMSISRVGGTTNHKWNLVNTGNGWYHCDASPRRRGDLYLCFMQTDAQVQVYTASYPEKPNYYTFDESLYPERATTVIYGEDPQSTP